MNIRKREFKSYRLYFPELWEVQRHPERAQFIIPRKNGQLIGYGVHLVRKRRHDSLWLVETNDGKSFVTSSANLFPMQPTNKQMLMIVLRCKAINEFKLNPPKPDPNQAKFEWHGVRGVDYCLWPEDRPYDHPLSIAERKRAKYENVVAAGLEEILFS